MRMQREIQKLWERIFDVSSNDCGNLLGFSYYAFISYTEKDEKWAEWLQWNLEHYKIPAKVRSENKELPKRVRPVFWYKNDLSGAHLSGAIKKELKQSKYMIVVCSPNSANKSWVNDEVRYFKDNLQRGEKIIPFIVDGEINAENSDQECLPLPIRNLPREKELRCIDVREYGKNKALVNIVSTLFNIRFDILWNRFKREQKRFFTFYSIIFVLCITALLGCWDYFWHTKYEYFVDIADCNGLPTGIMQIDNDEANEHYRLYRFEYRRRLLQRVVYVDCDGNPQNHINTEFADRPCIQEISYNNGEPTVINCKDAILKTLYIMHLSNDKLAVDLKDEDENQAANFIFSSTSVDQGVSFLQQSAFLDRILKSPSKIARYIYERDDDGYIIKKIFARHNGDNDDISMDTNGISGFEYERDSLHRVVRIHFLDMNYEYRENNKGVAGKKYKYDKDGNLAITEYVDKEGNLKYNERHWAKSVDIYDNKGYCVEERVYGADGKPCISVHGYHKMTVTTNGNIETFSLYDIQDKPTYSLSVGTDTGGYSKITYIRNKKGQVVEMQFKDSDGNLCYNQQHVAICKLEYDDIGLVVGVRNYGIDKQPCSSTNGYFYERSSYNQKGYLTDQSFYNIYEKPVQNNGGIHRVFIKYDKTGNRMVEAHVYNMDNLPVQCFLFNGASWIKLSYHGSSKWVSEVSFYGIDNKPIETSLGAKVSFERDHYGQIKVCKYYNEEYKLISNSYRSAIMELSYNAMGMEIDRCYFDENKKPMSLNGIFHIRRAYTKTGQLERIWCSDTLNNLRNCSEGWAVQEFNYRNDVISSNSYYGENRECIEVEGVHKYVFEIDECGYILSQSAYNKEMQPTINSKIGAHKVVNLYDDCRRNIGREYYDTMNMDPFVCIRIKLNQRGLSTEQIAYNARKELVESPLNFGVAKLQSKYDSQDRVVYMCSTNKNGEKMNSSYGFAEAYFSIDNNMQESVFLDSQENLVNYTAFAEPCAYAIMYMTDTGQRLYSKNLSLSYDGNVETIRYVNLYDIQGRQVQKAIQSKDEIIKVYEVSNNKMYTYFSFDDEYDKYTHIIDSVEHNVEQKYGKPKLDHLIK